MVYTFDMSKNNKLIKYSGNPILSPNPDNAWEDLIVCNPGVIYDEENKKFVMLYRAAGNDPQHIIHIGLATSDDGLNFTRQRSEPVLSPSPDNSDGGCIEDPRIIKIGAWYYITYAARIWPPGRYWTYDPLKYWRDKDESIKAKFNIGDDLADTPALIRNNGTTTHLCMTKDFINFKKLGRITDCRLDDRDVIIFPEKIGGRYARLSRPVEWSGPGWPCEKPSIWLSFSDDLMEWDKPSLLMQGEQAWEFKKIGGSCPPIKTEKGWLHIYHGVCKDNIYRVGAVMLDLQYPTKILGRTKDFIMEPETEFEKKGIIPNVVFPSGNVVKDNVLYVYYGCADKYVGVATAQLDKLIDDLLSS